MSQSVRDFEKSFVCTTAITTEFRCVMVDTSNDEAVILTTGATAGGVVGVTQTKTTVSGQDIVVRMTGTSKVVASGTITRGAFCTPQSDGSVIATTTGGNAVVGIALQSAVSGDIFEIMLTPGGSYNSQ